MISFRFNFFKNWGHFLKSLGTTDIDHIIKNLPTEEIRLTTTQVQLAISNSTNSNSTGPDGINIKHLKHLEPLAIRNLTYMYNTALNTNTISHL